MPRHETIEANLQDIFSKHKDFFDKIAETQQMDGYKNAFRSLHDKGFNLRHFEECFESLRQACQEAIISLENEKAKPLEAETSNPKPDAIIGGENEFRAVLNEHLGMKTVARPTLYNYLENLGIRKSIYTNKDLESVLEYIKGLKTTRKKE